MQRTTSKPTIAPPTHRGSRALSGGQTLRTWTIGPLPLVNQLLERVQLERFLPEQLGLREADGEHLNDDRIGRCLDRLFQADAPSLVLDVVRHLVQTFQVSLDELHNDSTTISFSGAYDDATQEESRGTRQRLAVLFGHSKDHRPDLKQLLYILAVTDDGGVPVYFTTASGNVTDDTTHWACLWGDDSPVPTSVSAKSTSYYKKWMGGQDEIIAHNMIPVSVVVVDDVAIINFYLHILTEDHLPAPMRPTATAHGKGSSTR